MSVPHAIGKVARGLDLSADEIASAFDEIMAGHATPAQIGGLLVGLRTKGETSDEIAGAARTMRGKAAPFECPQPAATVDTCGTGGDGAGSVNVSTIAAVVAAAAGAKVAKHGNRAQSSKCGSADVLETLGVKIDASREVSERCLTELGICFLFAPAFHAATRHAAGPRKELGTRTIFNLLGPLTNPAGVLNQIVGVFDGDWCEPVATALGKLGARSAYVVHGAGGLDEVSVRGATRLAEWSRERGTVAVREVSPRDFGLDEHDPAGLAGGTAQHNAQVFRAVLDGQQGAVRAAAVMEAALALAACGICSELEEGAARARAAIDDGTATRLLVNWTKMTNQ